MWRHLLRSLGRKSCLGWCARATSVNSRDGRRGEYSTSHTVQRQAQDINEARHREAAGPLSFRIETIVSSPSREGEAVIVDDLEAKGFLPNGAAE